jgi:NAD-dependent SIR2 family protein deacetylase
VGRLVQTSKATSAKEATCTDCGQAYDPSHPEHRPHGRYDQCGRCGRHEDSESGIVRLEGEQVWAHKSVSFCVIKGRKELDPEELARARRR